MNTTDLLVLLATTSLAGSAAVLLTVALARPLRRWAGADCAYRLWWMVPLAMLAVLLPARVERIEAASLPLVAHASDAPGTAGMAIAMTAKAVPDAGTWMLLVWILGLALVAWRCIRGHRRFVAGLGRLRPEGDGLFESEAIDGLPAVVGLGGRIVLPADFRTRFTPAERALVLAHERVHVRRRDVWWNLLAVALCALHWFNPLAWWALRRFRIEQELACDAAVLDQARGHRRSYAEALVKTQLSGSAVPLACQWPGTHPLKERIEMLMQPLPRRIGRGIGTTLVVASAFAFATAVWAAQPPRVEPAAGTPIAPTAPGLTVTHDAGADTLNISALDVPVGELAQRLAEATGRTLEVDDGVDVSGRVSLNFKAVSVKTVEQLIEAELDGARVQGDARTLRLVLARGG